MKRHPMPTVIWRILNMNRRLSGRPKTRMLAFPSGILADDTLHYALYDGNGDVTFAVRSFREAMNLRRRTGLHVTRILD